MSLTWIATIKPIVPFLALLTRLEYHQKATAATQMIATRMYCVRECSPAALTGKVKSKRGHEIATMERMEIGRCQFSRMCELKTSLISSVIMQMLHADTTMGEERKAAG